MSTKSIAALTRTWLALVAAASFVMLPSIATGATSSASSDFAAFATGIGCGAITISGNSYVDSFDSSKGTYSQTKQKSGGVVGANGNVNLTGQAVVYGSLAALNTAVGTCQNGTPGISLSGGAIVTSGYIRLSSRLSFPNPSPVVTFFQASFSALRLSPLLVGEFPSIRKACVRRIFSVTIPASFKRSRSIARFMAPQALKGIEKQTTTWDKAIVDRTSGLTNWVDILKAMVNDKKIRKLFAYANNHYAGHGPATVKLFVDLWDKKK